MISYATIYLSLYHIVIAYSYQNKKYKIFYDTSINNIETRKRKKMRYFLFLSKLVFLSLLV